MPVQRKIKIRKAEFYITNVCNLTCEYCNRFNNYNFKGWQDWKDYKQIYARWAELLDIDQLVIMGGEPFLNPTVCDWALGLADQWNRQTQIISNGTRINHVNGLYDALKTKKTWVSVTLHNPNEIEEIMSGVENFLQHPITKHNFAETGEKGNFDNTYRTWVDANNVVVPFWLSDSFVQSAIIKNDAGELTLHNSDPTEAHDICVFAQYKSYHFIRGKLYKCGPVALLPEFDNQNTLAISDEDRQLLNSYQPLTLENFDDYHEEFFKNLDNPIPQCKFCPSYYGGGKIYPLRKGS